MSKSIDAACLDDAIEKFATCTQLHGQVDVLPVLPDRRNTTSATSSNVGFAALLALSKLGFKTELSKAKRPERHLVVDAYRKQNNPIRTLAITRGHH